ncbi:hypothetical protein E4U53_004990, partial [Claviceps sorghi]
MQYPETKFVFLLAGLARGMQPEEEGQKGLTYEDPYGVAGSDGAPPKTLLFRSSRRKTYGPSRAYDARR